mgnify:CR=1 FL=1
MAPILKLAGNIVLIGPMGAGKSTLGRLLAHELGWPFHDSDKVIEQRTGTTIPIIFELEGEAGFRRRESEVIAELTQQHATILATGGGAVLAAENRRLLKASGYVVYLHAPLKILLDRTLRDRNRPLMQTADPAARMKQILMEREPLYREIADLTLETDHGSAHASVRHVLRNIGLKSRSLF